MLYQGVVEDGKTKRYDLDTAALKLRWKRKSLDDYLSQMRQAKFFGFDFDEHADQNFGIVRSFVRKMKNQQK